MILMTKRKSFYYNDWKYKIRWNEKATPFMTKHMNLENLQGKYLRDRGFGTLIKIRTAKMYKLKRKFKSKKSVRW